MIPANNDDLKAGFQFQELPTDTFFLHISKDAIAGFTDGLQAMAQAIYLILNTERYEHLIYSWNYGVELADLIGRPISYCIPEIRRRIAEALTQDSRIAGVDNFSFDRRQGKVFTSFTVHTVYGDIETEKAVEI
jgi:phage baseplate assembly protein W